MSAHSDPLFGLGVDALPYAEGMIPSQGSKDNTEININHHIAKQKNAELHHKARHKKPLEVMTKPHTREWPLERSPCETILKMDDEELGHNHHTQEWDSRVMKDNTMIKGHHQDRKDNNTNTEPLEGLTEETIPNEAPNEQVGRQWNEHLKEDWWKDTKITVIGKHMWKIITEPQHRLSTTKCNMLKIMKTPKEDHRRATTQELPEKYSKEKTNWNDAHHSQLIWQLTALRTNVQTLPTVIIVKDPVRDHNSITTDHDHIKAVVLLPYEAIIKALEIATFTGEQTLSLNNGSERAIVDKDTCLALSPHKGLCKQPTEGQMTTSRHQWTNEWFRDMNWLMELVLRALSNPRNDNRINWSLLIWSQVNKTLLIALRKTPCGLQEEDALYACQTKKENLLPEMRGWTETPQIVKLYAQRIMKNKRKLCIKRVQRTLYVKGWKEWLGRTCLSTSHLFTKLHSKEAGPLQNTKESAQ